MLSGEAQLARRVALLDQRCEGAIGCDLTSSDPAALASSAKELTRCFVEVLGEHTLELWDASTGPDAADLSTAFRVTATAADETVAQSRTLDALARCVPSIVDGPLDRTAQCWIAHGPHLPPAPELFVPVSSSPGAVREKPLRAGLYTSTSAFGRPAEMWLTYLEHGIDGSLFSMPRTAYSLVPSPDARILELTSASQWESLIRAYGVSCEGRLAPDWRLVAEDYDGVHMTARAVLATQGVQINTDRDSLVAPYWDVESTLWLSWRFDSYGLIGVV